MPSSDPMTRTRADRCPGVLRPWPAADGALVRLRVPGGHLSRTSLLALLGVAEAYGDGQVHLTSRANLQVRGLPSDGPDLLPEVVDAIRATGLLPHPSHELVRNVLVSPLTGLAGGRADLRGVGEELDRRVCATPALGALPGRFLFVLDDGRGDLTGRSCDLGLVALSGDEAQLRVGDGWGPVVPLADAARHLHDRALDFQRSRGGGPDAPWHVAELPAPPRSYDPDPRVPAASAPPPPGEVAPGVVHVPVAGGAVDRELAIDLPEQLVVTPWKTLVAVSAEA